MPCCDDDVCRILTLLLLLLSSPQACTPSWLPCMPCTGSGCTDSCCAGSSCQLAVKLGRKEYYTCAPQAPACLPEGGRCGDCLGGGMCCDGLICKWSFFTGVGQCTKPYTCGSLNQLCSADNDCCPGMRCGANGRCTSCTCDITCARSSFKHRGCQIQQKDDCKALSAASACKKRK